MTTFEVVYPLVRALKSSLGHNLEGRLVLNDSQITLIVDEVVKQLSQQGYTIEGGKEWVAR